MISGLTLSPSAVSPNGENAATLTFRLADPANVTICVLNADGAVTRVLARPGLTKGQLTLGYLGRAGLRSPALPTGHYTVLVVASNSSGSGTAEASLIVNTPFVQPQA